MAFRGWGRGLRRAIASWYLDKQPKDLAYTICKYQQRNGWTHRDLLRLSHPKPSMEAINTRAVLMYAAGKADEEVQAVAKLHFDAEDPLSPIWALEAAKVATDKQEVCRLIREYNLPRECVPTQFLTESSVWEALLERMPMTAMIRNLATMTRVGLLTPMSNAVGKVMAELTDVERLKKARIHPIAVLVALKTYAQGHGERGSNTWTPVAQVVDALDGAFYTSFGNIEPTCKRWMLALDVSGSMSGTMVAGMPFLPAVQAEAAMALVTAATEPQHVIVAFDTVIKPFTISPRQRLDDVVQNVTRLVNGGTDCAQPMIHALANKIPVDAFVLFTDSQSWQGQIHPVQAITQYRQRMGIPAKLIVVAMASNEFSVGDAEDGGMLNCAGFSTDVPAVIADFVRG